jgi:hypothetical protein
MGVSGNTAEFLSKTDFSSIWGALGLSIVMLSRKTFEEPKKRDQRRCLLGGHRFLALRLHLGKARERLETSQSDLDLELFISESTI